MSTGRNFSTSVRTTTTVVNVNESEVDGPSKRDENEIIIETEKPGYEL